MKKEITGILAGAAAGLLARSEYERRRLQVCRYSVRARAVKEPVRMAVLADLHDWSFGKENRRLLEAIEKERPDLVLIAGDMMTVKPWKKGDFRVCESLLRRLSERYPVYYGNGNHEQRMALHPDQYPGWYRRFTEFLKQAGIHYLRDETAVISLPCGNLYISGLDLEERFYDAKFRTEPMEKGYIEERLGKTRKRPGDFQILLAHSPLYFPEYAAWGADLVLSGHFHGGTVRLPGIGGVMSPQCQMFPKWDRGMYRLGKSRMAVSAGLGTHSINVRLNNRPTLMMIELRKDEHGNFC